MINVGELVRNPTVKQLEQMEWGFKFVGLDLCTRGHGDPHRYHLGAWNDAEGPVLNHDGGCPRAVGDGLCVALDVRAASSGGQSMSRSIMLIAGFLPEDVLGRANGNVRVRRMWIEPDPVDPVQLALWVIASGDDADLLGADLQSADLLGANLLSADLWGADLLCANLRGANLRRANLRGANLLSADLWGANLRGADLRGANLWGANLLGANLRSADLLGANLRGANLRRADLCGANLRRADLWGANLRGANLRSANLRGANLWGAEGNADTQLPTEWTVTATGLVVSTKGTSE